MSVARRLSVTASLALLVSVLAGGPSVAQSGLGTLACRAGDATAPTVTVAAGETVQCHAYWFEPDEFLHVIVTLLGRESSSSTVLLDDPAVFLDDHEAEFQFVVAASARHGDEVLIEVSQPAVTGSATESLVLAVVGDPPDPVETETPPRGPDPATEPESVPADPPDADGSDPGGDTTDQLSGAREAEAVPEELPETGVGAGALLAMAAGLGAIGTRLVSIRHGRR